jgi:hypothetical protein
MHDHEIEIERQGDWLLVECTKYSKDGWKSLKLFLDRKVRKNVWRLGVKDGHMARTYDAGLLQSFYPDVFDWVAARASGKNVPFPANDQEMTGAAVPVSPAKQQFIIEAVKERQATSRPWSHKVQVRKAGRYIGPLICDEFRVSDRQARILVESMIKQGLLEYVMFNKNNRLSGLRVATPMEIDNG